MDSTDNNHPDRNNLRRVIAIILIFLGVILNKYFIELTIVSDGAITSLGKNLIIVFIQLVFITTGILLLLRKRIIHIKVLPDPASFTGIIGLFFFLLLLPPIFGRIFAMSPLLSNEIRGLWIFSGIIFLLSMFLIFTKSKSRSKLSLLFFAFLLLAFIELSARLIINITSPNARNMLARLCNRTYPQNLLYTGHPFMNYTFNPKYRINDAKTKGEISPFNRYGFKGSDYSYAKPSNTVRVACLGGSTTAHGYPKILQDYLASKKALIKDSVTFECMNFGVSGYSSAHSLVNFVLNVVDFNPDYIILLHGWNEEMVRNVPPEVFKTDYSHSFKYFNEPKIIDLYPIRISIIYRYFKQVLTNEPDWAFLQSATVNRTPGQLLQDMRRYEWENSNETAPYRRNFETIIDLALLRGIKPVILTMAHTVNPEADHYEIYPLIDQNNEIVRQLWKKYQDEIIFVDLDSLITGKYDEFFIDLAHMTLEGEQMMSRAIGDSILKDYLGRN